MRNHHALMAAVVAAALLAVAGPVLASQDDAALRSYVLTSDKLQRYGALSATLKHEGARDPALRAEMKTAGDASGGTLTTAVAAMRRHPVLLGYIHRAGLTEQDMVLIPLTVMGATMAQQLSPAQRKTYPVSPASIDFVEHHKAEVAAVAKTMH